MSAPARDGWIRSNQKTLLDAFRAHVTDLKRRLKIKKADLDMGDPIDQEERFYEYCELMYDFFFSGKNDFIDRDSYAEELEDEEEEISAEFTEEEEEDAR